MAKSDEHMQKVRKNLMAKQASQARTEKVRQLRDQKKIAKRVQVMHTFNHYMSDLRWQGEALDRYVKIKILYM